jgi:acetyltransferase-like isoleucine patch superfamily enzyme
MITKLVKYLYHLYLLKTDPVKYARVLGVDVGEGTRFMGIKLGAFSTEPYLIKIGKNCLITADVQFVTHDGSIYHLKNKYPDVDYIDKIIVGDNVFIGLRAIILPGVTIGNNVVIGAGSVVTRNIPSNAIELV